jgi:hypothetical protein
VAKSGAAWPHAAEPLRNVILTSRSETDGRHQHS